METLTPTQLANLYYIMFNVSEGSPSNQDQLIPLMNDLATFNGNPTYEQWIPDNEGSPINATPNVYAAFNEMVEQEEPEWPGLTQLFNNPNPTMQDLLEQII